jgi:hypothetical protein
VAATQYFKGISRYWFEASTIESGRGPTSIQNAGVKLKSFLQTDKNNLKPNATHKPHLAHYIQHGHAALCQQYIPQKYFSFCTEAIIFLKISFVSLFLTHDWI